MVVLQTGKMVVMFFPGYIADSQIQPTVDTHPLARTNTVSAVFSIGEDSAAVKCAGIGRTEKAVDLSQRGFWKDQRGQIGLTPLIFDPFDFKAEKGDCCVYCSYGEVKCPPVQQGTSCCS